MLLLLLLLLAALATWLAEVARRTSAELTLELCCDLDDKEASIDIVMAPRLLLVVREKGEEERKERNKNTLHELCCAMATACGNRKWERRRADGCEGGQQGIGRGTASKQRGSVC